MPPFAFSKGGIDALQFLQPPKRLVFPELLEKPVLFEFLKQRKIDKTFRRHVPCPRLLLGHFIQDKFYSLQCGVGDLLQSLRVEGIGVVQNLFVVHPQIFF